MSDPTLSIQAAIVAALKAHNPTIAGDRIYDNPLQSAIFPYVTVGEGDTVGDDNSCWDASEVNVSVHVWSRPPGGVGRSFSEAKEIAGLVRDALATTFSLSGFVMPVGQFRLARFLRDPDGLTSHAALEFTYLVDHDF